VPAFRGSGWLYLAMVQEGVYGINAFDSKAR